jgi:hypothetical protein
MSDLIKGYHRFAAFAADPIAIVDRRARGVKYAVFGINDSTITELSASSMDEARTLADTWSTMFKGTAYCFCVQNGEIGGRPVDSYSKK